MKGSTVSNIKLDSNKQKIINCVVCGDALVVGKFAKKNQICIKCKDIPTGKDKTEKKTEIRRIENNDLTFGARLIKLSEELGFEVNKNRQFKKNYPVDGGGITTVYIHVSSGVMGKEPALEYFSVITQRAVGVNEKLKKFMPLDAVNDCAVLISELGETKVINHNVGRNKCNDCGELTDEYGVDTKHAQILCIKPNNCFKKKFTLIGAESEE